MMIFRAPKRWINRGLLYAGIFGVVFQLCAAVFMLWHGLAFYAGWWFTLLAPVLCIGSGLVPALQLQKEAD